MDDLISGEKVAHAATCVRQKRKYTVPIKDDYIKEATTLKIANQTLTVERDNAIADFERVNRLLVAERRERLTTPRLLALLSIVAAGAMAIGALCGWAVCHG